MRNATRALYLHGILILPPFSTSADRIQWVPYHDGMKRARQERAVALVAFWSEWSGTCKKMDHLVFSDPRLIEASKRFVMVRVDVDSEWQLTGRYAVLSAPTLLSLDPWDNLSSSAASTPSAVGRAPRGVGQYKPGPADERP